MKSATEIADLCLKVLSCLAILVAGAWGLWVFWVGGADEWQCNVAIETQVLPYSDDMRLLVVHVKSKNPRNTTFELIDKDHDSFVLRVRKLAPNAKAGTVFPENEGELLATVDILARLGGDYEFVPGAEMDDMQAIVVPVGTIVSLAADMEMHTGTLDRHGKPETDTNGVSAVVHVGP
ncbi:hypothetical protein OKW33_000812 [Paraburkholderia atlantica]|uniref:hypothetical protein n=1 Tax=Paraburkholderia atlantica TaxID=2654982 RepID=UPI003D1A95D9